VVSGMKLITLWCLEGKN